MRFIVYLIFFSLLLKNASGQEVMVGLYGGPAFHLPNKYYAQTGGKDLALFMQWKINRHSWRFDVGGSLFHYDVSYESQVSFNNYRTHISASYAFFFLNNQKWRSSFGIGCKYAFVKNSSDSKFYNDSYSAIGPLLFTDVSYRFWLVDLFAKVQYDMQFVKHHISAYHQLYPALGLRFHLEGLR